MKNYIDYYEFLNQEEKVQNVFLKYFKGKEGLYFDGIGCIKGYGKMFTNLGVVPALQEHQLRQFIEDKIKDKIEIIITFNDNYKVIASTFNLKCHNTTWQIEGISNNLLQAYWQVAVQIAKEWC